MADSALEFGDGSWDEAKGTIISTLRSHDKILNGNGKSGVIEEVAEVKTRLAVIEGYGKASAFWGKVTAAVLTLGLSAIGIILMIRGH